MSIETVPKTSRAAVLTAHGEPLEIRELPIPTELEPGALLVKIEAATVCGSDLHLWDGSLAGSQALSLPVIPGHEMVGSVVRIGEGAERDTFGQPLRAGDRICFTHASCNQCEHCRLDNQPTLCANRQYYMFTSCAEAPYLVGGFAEYCYVFPNSGRVKVPDEVPTEWASAASCALRTVVHSFDRIGRLNPWETVVIQGSGPLGLFATALADHLGAERVITIGAPEDRLKIATSFGATDIVSIADAPEPRDRIDAVRGLLGGRGADVVFEFSGARTAFTEGLGMIKEGGRYMVTGQIDGPGKEVPVRPGFITRQQLTIMGTWSGHIAEYRKALQFMRNTRRRYDFGTLVPHRYPLEQATEALTRMRAQQDIKPVLVPHATAAQVST
ncbi:zinc-binding dehydrogenase [Streptomyces melanosporofaciens]|uniref:2-deoxy-scyllo-inosamine dehydrogenase n=1 Tax=Streptomyces melanosporofaciens TaxID=67327 RepID=A0A1H4I996_STRMJ|nr:zinc-binding dehydrogenase [Streptomyces melanosporofaciens]SEB30523.1 D-arabinose 1-dehydrogenase, Zn-dependent alcohol dehydrogenase family [Streptomyces melanosporofaciens]